MIFLKHPLGKAGTFFVTILNMLPSKGLGATMGFLDIGSVLRLRSKAARAKDEERLCLHPAPHATPCKIGNTSEICKNIIPAQDPKQGFYDMNRPLVRLIGSLDVWEKLISILFPNSVCCKGSSGDSKKGFRYLLRGGCYGCSWGSAAGNPWTGTPFLRELI